MAPFFSRFRNILLLCLIYFSVSLFFLGRYPLVHSDEAWLAGLSLRMMETRSLGVTEPFFDLFPRYPHAIKILYHLLQMPFLVLGGFNHLSVRILSLLAGSCSLVLLYRILRPPFGEQTALTGAALIALNIQFILTSHTARQEAVILTLMLLVMQIGLDERYGKSSAFKQGLVIALAIGVHPNAFFIFLPALLLLLFRISRKEMPFRMVWRFLLPVTAGAVVFIALSFFFDPDFLRHYFAYGSSVGISADPSGRLKGFFAFYGKLFYAVTGTYTVPGQKVLWVLYALVFVCSLISLKVQKEKKPPLLAESLIILFGLNAGYLLVGKYSQPSIVFILPFVILLFLAMIQHVQSPFRVVFSAALGVLFLAVSVVNIRPVLDSDYRAYLKNIETALPAEGSVLANLNAGFLFHDRDFRDFRNLAWLDEVDMSFADYIDANSITALVVPEELSFIYENRPRWNILYGNIVPWYREMMAFIDQRCVLSAEFEDPYYAMRISPYTGRKPWVVRVYHVLPSKT